VSKSKTSSEGPVTMTVEPTVSAGARLPCKTPRAWIFDNLSRVNLYCIMIHLSVKTSNPRIHKPRAHHVTISLEMFRPKGCLLSGNKSLPARQSNVTPLMYSNTSVQTNLPEGVVTCGEKLGKKKTDTRTERASARQPSFIGIYWFYCCCFSTK
jgi:hypothetical protein